MPAIEIWAVLKKAVATWSDAKAPSLGAALAYYTGFSIVPLLAIGLAIASWVFGAQEARNRLIANLNVTVGTGVTSAVDDLLGTSSKQPPGAAAFGFGVVVLIFGASGVFGELQNALNTIWQVAPKPGRGWMYFLHDRLLSFGMVLATCFVLLTSLVMSAALSYFATMWTPKSMPGGAFFWQGVNQLVSFAVVTVMFALIFRFVPDATTVWNDIWLGAATTAFLFTLGKYLLGRYLSYSGMMTAQGAAGSLAALLFWVYYSAQIFLFGAALTRVYAQRVGVGVEPTENAVRAPLAPHVAMQDR